MKLRLHENSIRLRLLQDEVRQLRELGSVSETINFGTPTSEHLTFSLRRSFDVDHIVAQFSDNQIKILLPSKMTEDWIDNDDIGLYAEQQIVDCPNLKITVEKDLCLSRQPERRG